MSDDNRHLRALTRCSDRRKYLERDREHERDLLKERERAMRIDLDGSDDEEEPWRRKLFAGRCEAVYETLSSCALRDISTVGACCSRRAADRKRRREKENHDDEEDREREAAELAKKARLQGGVFRASTGAEDFFKAGLPRSASDRVS